jgi:hypothetical protein
VKSFAFSDFPGAGLRGCRAITCGLACRNRHGTIKLQRSIIEGAIGQTGASHGIIHPSCALSGSWQPAPPDANDKRGRKIRRSAVRPPSRGAAAGGATSPAAMNSTENADRVQPLGGCGARLASGTFSFPPRSTGSGDKATISWPADSPATGPGSRIAIIHISSDEGCRSKPRGLSRTDGTKGEAWSWRNNARRSRQRRTRSRAHRLRDRPRGDQRRRSHIVLACRSIRPGEPRLGTIHGGWNTARCPACWSNEPTASSSMYDPACDSSPVARDISHRAHAHVARIRALSGGIIVAISADMRR